MEFLLPHTSYAPLDAAVFDFDGTLSGLRAGWEGVMGPLMCRLIPGEPAEVRALVDRYIDESTGIQTIHQMRWLAEEIERRGGRPEDPWTYKDEYNRLLMQEVQRRRDAVESGEEPAEAYRIPGGIEFLTALREGGAALYAASGTDTADVREEARVLGLDGFFAGIRGAERNTDRCSKEAVLRDLVRPGLRLLIVGDGKVEIALGREAGALTLGIASQDVPGCASHALNMQKYRRLKAAGAHAVTADFAEWREILSWI